MTVIKDNLYNLVLKKIKNLINYISCILSNRIERDDIIINCVNVHFADGFC